MVAGAGLRLCAALVIRAALALFGSLRISLRIRHGTNYSTPLRFSQHPIDTSSMWWDDTPIR